MVETASFVRTNERIAEAAQSMTLDTVFFLTGEDSKDE